MTSKRLHALINGLMIILLALLASSANAQSASVLRTFQSPDDSYAFAYAPGWEVQHVRGMTYVSQPGVTLTIAGPVTLARAGLPTAVTPEILLAEVLARLEAPPTAPITLEGLNRRLIGRLEGARGGYAGSLLAIPLRSGELALVDMRFTDVRRAETEPQALALLATLDTPYGIPPRTLPPETAQPADILQALETAETIPAGAQLLFTAPRIQREAQGGAVFMALGDTASEQDVVMGGTLRFDAGTGGEGACALGLRLAGSPEQPLTAYLEAGITHDGHPYYIDHTADPTVEHRHISFRQVAGDTHTLVVIVRADRMSAYVDGARVLDRVPVESRAGALGVGAISQTGLARCEATGVWAYRLPTAVPGTCEITSADRVNRRAGPGLGFAPVAVLEPGERIRAIGRIENASGAWWQLEDGSFVNASVVTASGYCGEVPTTTP
ncbi:MAG: hypothetical protein Kow0077_19840 [Anaerolineae bacterium]